MSRPGPWALLRMSPWWLVLLGTAIVAGLAIEVGADPTDSFDRAVIDVVRSDALATLLSPLRWITELGSTGAVTAVAILVFVVGAVIGAWKHGLAGAVTIGLASLAVEGIKGLVARVRPDALDPIVVERGFSFPSGHATLSTVAYGVLTVLISRSRLPPGVRLAILAGFGVLVFLIGVSRIWLGVHYPTDVLGGWTAGAVIVLVYAGLTRSVSPGPGGEGVDAGRAGQRFDPPAPG